MDETILSQLEEQVGKLCLALKAYKQGNEELRKHREALLEETTRLHDEVLRLNRVQAQALHRVKTMQQRLSELEDHVAL